jgi:hypothetical protein
MLSISHSLTGAFLAVTLQNPVLYTPAIFASHYLEDWIPHWDVGTGLTKGTRKRQDAIIMEFGELAITGVLLYFFFQHGQSGINWLAWIGGFVALIPDFLEAPRNFLKWEPDLIKPLNNLHAYFHHSTPNMVVGLTPQIALWIAIWLMR